MKFLESTFIFCAAISILRSNSVCGSTAEKQLIRHLLNDYEIEERPVENHQDNVTVKISLTIIRVDDVVDDMHHVELTAWLSLKWIAYNLQWSPADFENVVDIRLHPSKIWVPDIYTYSFTASSLDRLHETLVVLKSNGSAYYIPPGQITNPCSLSSESSYPFEKLTCELKFGSWVYNGHQVDLQLQSETGADLSALVENPEWKVLECPAKRTVTYYKCCSGNNFEPP